MNGYKLLILNNGYVQTLYIQAYDISQAATTSGYMINDIIKIELVGSTNI